MFFLHITSTSFFFFNDTATTEIYTLSLHDALPISCLPSNAFAAWRVAVGSRSLILCLVRPHARHRDRRVLSLGERDRKSTRLNSSHANISYAVFCLKKKTQPYLLFIHLHF